MNSLHVVRRWGLQWVLAFGCVLLALATAAQPARAMAPPVSTRTVLVMGDSLSAAHGLAESEGWVALLAQRLAAGKPGWRVVNASISGETTAGGATRVARELARNQPTVLVIELGANDGLRGLPLAQMKANLAAMMTAAQGAHAKILLIGMRIPPNYGQAYGRAFEQSYIDLAHQYGTAFVPFLLAPIALDRSAFQADNLHPVAAAEPKLLEHVWPVLGPLLK